MQCILKINQLIKSVGWIQIKSSYTIVLLEINVVQLLKLIINIIIHLLKNYIYLKLPFANARSKRKQVHGLC